MGQVEQHCIRLSKYHLSDGLIQKMNPYKMELRNWKDSLYELYFLLISRQKIKQNLFDRNNTFVCIR